MNKCNLVWGDDGHQHCLKLHYDYHDCDLHTQPPKPSESIGGSMTPTEQDKELRTQIAAFVIGNGLSPLGKIDAVEKLITKREKELQQELLRNFIKAFNRAGKDDGNDIRIITNSFNLQNFLKIEAERKRLENE